MSTADPFDLNRFVAAQDLGGTYDTALAELRAGRKRSHWMWFVFPQLAGLGRSAMAQRYAVSSLAEASTYLAHPVLGPRLAECAEALLFCGVEDATEILGEVDARKLQSSMTLFARADPSYAVWVRVLDRFFAGQFDPDTEREVDACGPA